MEKGTCQFCQGVSPLIENFDTHEMVYIVQPTPISIRRDQLHPALLVLGDMNGNEHSLHIAYCPYCGRKL